MGEQRGPRPLDYIRIRVYRGGQAEYLRDLMADEKEELFREVGEMRGNGVPEDAPEMAEKQAQIRHLLHALRDLENGMLELVGPDGY